MNQREIKFRARVHSEEPFWLLMDNITIFDFFKSVEVWSEKYKVDLVEFIGLKDKNKKEIYEGDLLRYFKDRYGKVYIDKKPKIVKWIKTRRVNGWNIGSARANKLTCEVIGNIYENPELLK